MNDSYHFLSVDFVTEQWELATLQLSYTKSEGSTTCEDLAHAIGSMAMHRGLPGRVMAYTIDC